VTKSAEMQPLNHLLDDPSALRQQADEDGFLFFRGLVPADPILSLRRQFLQVCDKHGWIAPGTALIDGIADPSADEIEPVQASGVSMAGYQDVQRLEAFHQLSHHPAIISMLETLFGETVFAHPRNIGRLMIPAKCNVPTPPHQDYIYIQGTNSFYSLWMPLGNCPRQLGGLSTLRGSHKLGLLPTCPSAGAGGRAVILDGIEQEWFEADFEIGDVLFFHNQTVHKSLPNLTDNQIRLSVDYRYQPASQPIVQSTVRPHGDVLTWEEVYEDWNSTELRYYWKDYEMSIEPFDGALTER